MNSEFDLTPATFDIQTIYIPRVHRDTSEEYIKSQFDFYDLADVKRVDFLFKYNRAGTLIFKQAFVHLQWFNNACSQRLRGLVEVDRTDPTCNAPQARLIYDDPHYWILLQAHSPLDDISANEAENLAESGDIGRYLRDTESNFSPTWYHPKKVSHRFRVLELAFNKLKQKNQELAHSSKINTTLLQGMSDTNAQLREAHWGLSWSNYYETQKNMQANEVIREQQIRSDNLLKRCERLQQAYFNARSEADSIKRELEEAHSQLSVHNEVVDIDSWTNLTPRETNPSCEQYLHPLGHSPTSSM